MNPTPEGLVNNSNTICREKEDSSVILKDPKEDCVSKVLTHYTVRLGFIFFTARQTCNETVTFEIGLSSGS